MLPHRRANDAAARSVAAGDDLAPLVTALTTAQIHFDRSRPLRQGPHLKRVPFRLVTTRTSHRVLARGIRCSWHGFDHLTTRASGIQVKCASSRDTNLLQSCRSHYQDSPANTVTDSRRPAARTVAHSDRRRAASPRASQAPRPSRRLSPQYDRRCAPSRNDAKSRCRYGPSGSA